MPRDRRDVTPVYSTGSGRIGTPAPQPAGPPSDGIVRVSRTKAGRQGKVVTLVSGVPAGRLAEVGRDLKRLCGSGGAVKDGVIEIQGDHRDRVAERLSGDFSVKLAGG